MLPQGIDVLSLADINCHVDIPETADTLEGNALQKAQFIYENYGYDCFAASEFIDYLRRQRIEDLIICGVFTDGCVDAQRDAQGHRNDHGIQVDQQRGQKTAGEHVQGRLSGGDIPGGAKVPLGKNVS